MTSRPHTVANFREAKADFLTMVREAKAVEGIINGHDMEEELVSADNLISFF